MATVTTLVKCYTSSRLLKKNPKKIGATPSSQLLGVAPASLSTLEKEEQIVGTQEKSQQIVAQRLLSCLQYLDATKSSAKDLSLPSVNL